MEILNDFRTSVVKSLAEMDSHWDSYDGLVVAGTHHPKDTERIIEKIREARSTNRPFLGICMGLQLAVIEYSRNVLGIEQATSQEMEPGSPYAVVTKMPELRVGIRWTRWWSGEGYQSFWHNYKVSDDLKLYRFDTFYSKEGILDAMKHLYHPYFAGVQFHPEYQSSKKKPHPVLREFLEACRQREIVQ